MKKYLISELAEEFNTSKTQIRRIIEENNIVALNETEREHKYVAKVYSEQLRKVIRAELQPEQNGTIEENKSEQENNNSLELIKILKEDKERLIRELDELKKDKRDQELRFHEEKQSFHNLIREDKKNIEFLQIEIKKSFENIQEETNHKWYDIFSKKKRGN